MTTKRKVGLIVLAIIVILVAVALMNRAEAAPTDKAMALSWTVDMTCGTTAYPDSARSPEIAKWGLDGSATVLGTQAAANKADRTMVIPETNFEYGKKYWVEMYVNLAPNTPGCESMSPPSPKVYKTMPAAPVVPPKPPIVTLGGLAFEQQKLPDGKWGINEIGTIASGKWCGDPHGKDPLFRKVNYNDVVFRSPGAWQFGILWAPCHEGSS